MTSIHDHINSTLESEKDTEILVLTLLCIYSESSHYKRTLRKSIAHSDLRVMQEIADALFQLAIESGSFLKGGDIDGS